MHRRRVHRKRVHFAAIGSSKAFIWLIAETASTSKQRLFIKKGRRNINPVYRRVHIAAIGSVHQKKCSFAAIGSSKAFIWFIAGTASTLKRLFIKKGRQNINPVHRKGSLCCDRFIEKSLYLATIGSSKAFIWLIAGTRSTSKRLLVEKGSLEHQSRSSKRLILLRSVHRKRVHFPSSKGFISKLV